MDDDTVTLGDRIRKRRGKLYSQEKLAERAGVSVILIRKLEQNQRQTASIPSLQKIARALDVSVADLLDKPRSMPQAEENAGVVAIRHALTPVDDFTDDAADDESVSLENAGRSVKYMWGAYWAGKYEELGRLIPPALNQLRATYRDATTGDRPKAARLLAYGYQVAGDTLVHLGQQDLAFYGVREALRVARDGDDPLLYESIKLSMSWQLLVQGRFEESENVATVAAHGIEPNGKVGDSQLSLYGLFTVTAATAAARALKRDATNDLIAISQETAKRLGYERADHSTTFGPTKVAMLTVDSHIVQDNFTEALTAAKGLRGHADALPLASRARHLADTAFAHMRVGHTEKALNLMLAADSMAADWMQVQVFPKQIVRELLTHERPTRLRELAARLGVVN